MKKIECSKITTLDPREVKQVFGGSRRSDALNTALGGDRGCGAGARDAQNGNMDTKVDHHGGCGSEASKRNGGGNRGGSSRVICTHFYRKGMLDADVWRADLQYTQNHLSETTVRGYHYWAIPYVELMRKSPLAEKLMYPIAKYRAIELAYQMKIVKKGSLRGKAIRLVIEPACFLIGSVCKQKDWQALWQK